MVVDILTRVDDRPVALDAPLLRTRPTSCRSDDNTHSHAGALRLEGLRSLTPVKLVNETFEELGLENPDKTSIGRVERGFDFLGYHLAPGRLTLSRATVERFLERAHRLYEQERGKPEGFPQLGAYVRRWIGWAVAVTV